jgi:ankyrin repeat protein
MENSLTDEQGNNSLHNAVLRGKITMVRNILSEDKSGIDARNSEGLTPLLISVSRLNFGITDMLLRFGADPNLSRPGDGYSPLHIAAVNGVNWLGEILLEHKANINRQNRDGLSSLMLAIQGQHREFIALLVRQGAALDITDRTGKTALAYALDWGTPELAEMLHEK